MKSLLTSLLTLMLFVSCGSYVSQMHQEFDRYDHNITPEKKVQANFDMYRGKFDKRRRRPLNTERLISSSNRKYVSPKVKRAYQAKQNFRKRYKADDMEDNTGGGSLWSQNSIGKPVDFLFTQNKKKQNGDIILINVFAGLKREITLELRRAFPTFRKKKKSDDKDGEKKDGEAAAGPKPAAVAQEPDPSKAHDRISSVIIEEINQNHVLLRGRKHVLYKNRKRLVEVQALVTRRDILDDDTVSSENFLESSVNVLR